MRATRKQALARWVLFLDGALLLAALPLAAALHPLLRQAIPAIREPPSLDQLAVLPILFIPLFLLVIAASNLHRVFDGEWTWPGMLWGLARVHLIAFVALTMLVFLTQQVLNRSLTALFLGCTFSLLALERAVLGSWVRFQYARGLARQRFLLVGEPSDFLLAHLERLSSGGLSPLVVGLLSAATDERVQVSRRGAPTPEALEHVLSTEAIDEVLFFAPFARPTDAEGLLAVCEELGVAASFPIEVPERALTLPEVIEEAGLPVMRFSSAARAPARLALKHFVDVLAAAVLLLLLWPVLAVAALLILVTMGRPIFFVQERAGLYGRPFRMLKFRTMARDAEARKAELLASNELAGPAFKLTNDPRVTRLGRVLRKASIDELPQLFHVLSGAMSLVGPRPLPIGEQRAIRGWQRRRLSMKPGITGLWQVSGRSDLGFEEWMRLDLEYVDRWSPWLDLVILLRTIPTVLSARGAK